ncbi:bifunctional riboflavin kinase/FAD synthetase [Lonepinella sp. MS14435]|uniref:bifunctional riboflavin kinase/FAD synthetase n=1 Tax=Lonepinella sp. MS14435 TaxID=3003618 RepID=UPI0036D9932F
MQLIRSIHHFPRNFSPCALTIGNFDGIHLGHQKILTHLKEKARALNLPTVVMIFEPQPREYFQGEKAPARLMRLRDKLHYFQQAGIDYVICAKFDRTFAEQTAQDFISELLVNKLNVKFLSIGDDFHFGQARQGNFALLQQASQKYRFEVENNRTFCLNELRISSSAIRQALAEDRLADAEKLLGRPYCIWGKVIHGQKLGRTLGFPTANIHLHRQVNPIKGVYAVQVKLNCGQIVQGIANIGQRPTVQGLIQLLEVHLFDFDQNLYGQNIQVEFCYKLRNEIKFASLEALKQQIQQDADIARAYFYSK